MEPLTSLVAASIAFVGSHFAMSHPLRAPLVRGLGERGFLLLYSAVSTAALVWMVFAFRAAPSFDLPGNGEAGWIAATLLTLPALVLFAGSLAGNPALPHPGAIESAGDVPHGVFKVTRHPMMWGFGLWALAHLTLLWSWRTTIVASAILILALIGAHLQDRKKERLTGQAWRRWEATTSYWPRWGKLLSVGWLWWAIGIALWLAASYGHILAAGVPAGIWRWLG